MKGRGKPFYIETAVRCGSGDGGGENGDDGGTGDLLNLLFVKVEIVMVVELIVTVF